MAGVIESGRARPGRRTAAERLGVRAVAPPKLPAILKDLEKHPAELKLAQRLYLLRVRDRFSFPEIVEKSASFNIGRKRGKLSLGTVYNYVKAYTRYERQHGSEDQVQDEIRAVELELSGLMRKREKAGNLADYLKLTREIREYMDMIQELKGVKSTAPMVAVQQTAVQGGITFEQAMRGFRVLDQADVARPA
jgi:hypothetical protein